MALSDEILSLLRTLDEAQMDISYCIDDLEMNREELRSYSSSEGQTGSFKYYEGLNGVGSSLKKSKEPVKELSDEVIQTLSEIVKDESLNIHFTILALTGVPGVVKRWKKLRSLRFMFLPGEKVTNYLRQATTCYLYGLPDAVAILCRAILQYAIEEAFELRGMLQNLREINGKGYLEKLIDLAKHKRIISPGLATKAHSIRKIGNNSVHESSCSQSQARVTLQNTGEILMHIYGSPSNNAQ